VDERGESRLVPVCAPARKYRMDDDSIGSVIKFEQHAPVAYAQS
jgi:hypothetical protein